LETIPPKERGDILAALAADTTKTLMIRGFRPRYAAMGIAMGATRPIAEMFPRPKKVIAPTNKLKNRGKNLSELSLRISSTQRAMVPFRSRAEKKLVTPRRIKNNFKGNRARSSGTGIW
jgi:hypothetical protein